VPSVEPQGSGRTLLYYELLCIVRHADGKVYFWDMNLSASTKLLYCLDTASVFVSDADQQTESSSAPSDEDWPPFRKVFCL